MSGEEQDRELVNKDLIWSATAEGINDAQFAAMRMRDANAIRPIPSRTALGHEHLMADADRTALLAEIDRLHADAERERAARRIIDLGMRKLMQQLEAAEQANTVLEQGTILAVEARDALALELAEGNASDGHHTHNELYLFRMVLHAFAVRTWLDDGYAVVKSRRHHDGEEPFEGSGWFIVVAEVPTGDENEPTKQASNHYRKEFWDLFDVPEVERAPVWDGHSPEQALNRMLGALKLPRLPRQGGG